MKIIYLIILIDIVKLKMLYKYFVAEINVNDYTKFVYTHVYFPSRIKIVFLRKEIVFDNTPLLYE